MNLYSYPSGISSGASVVSHTTNRRRSIPTWGPARPTPSAWIMVSCISSSRVARRSSNLVTGRQTLFRMGSPSLTMLRIAIVVCLLYQSYIGPGRAAGPASDVAVRVHIHGHAGPGGQFFLLVQAQHLPQQGAEALVVAALDGELIAVDLVDLQDAAGGGPQHPQGDVGLPGGLLCQQGGKAGGGGGGLLLLFARKADDAQAAKGRVQPQLAVLDRLGEKGVVVLGGRQAQDGVVGVGGLDDGPPRRRGPAAAAHHLGHQAEHRLVRPEPLGK